MESPSRTRYSWYPICLILMCVRLVINAASPYRNAAMNLKIGFETLPELEKYKAPSFTTIKRWVQKVGYYKLIHPKIIANDWMVIIDASIQMGEQKCLVVFGCRASDLPKNRALTLKDFEVLALRVFSKLNGNLITQVLNEVALSVGEFICICSDRGSDILLGIRQFRVTSPKTRHIHDTAHRVANFLKAVLEGNSRWKKFRNQVTLSRRKMQNSLVAGALPPSPRTKARYMNVDSLIKWAADMLILLDNEKEITEFDIKELRKYLSWLSEYRDDINYWNRLVSMAATARQLVRVEGIHMDIANKFKHAISSIAVSCRELKFAKQISIFLSEQSSGLKPGERFIGSTEVLESFFGKLKFMEREQTAFGFTSLILAAIACVGSLDNATVTKAIETVRLSEIDEWAKKEIGKSIQSQRRTIRKVVKKIITKTEQEASGFLEREVVGF